MEVSQLLGNITFNNMGRRPRINKAKISEWLCQLIESYNKSLIDLNYTFCTDQELLEINIEYLQHDYYTDIISFDLSELKNEIHGDIYISIDRVKENAKQNKCSFEIELNRVLAHGLLHLIGFKDKTKKEIKAMREAEDEALAIWEKFQVSRETILK
jgi:probable rRNA maturation factor